ncbi:MAG: hypothetical protein JHD16_05610 [Solirubrobacteraceae bacterium]|nr:hypothetical protein [Solirubrobacteraceae bacterium]
MRNLSRIAVLGAVTAAAAAAAPSAMAANSAVATLTPNKGGSLTVAAPTTFKLTTTTPDVIYDNSGNTRIKAIKANLPEQLLFNTTGFTPCNTAAFLVSKTCSSKSKLGSAVVEADGGPDIGKVMATTDLYFGTGFTVLARVKSDSPAVIDQPVVGELRSSGVRGYGLQMYIPVPADIAMPIERVYPVIRSVTATVKPPTRSVRVPGEKKKVKLPLAGLGECKGALNFQVSIVYTDALGVIDKSTDSAATKATCKK